MKYVITEICPLDSDPQHAVGDIIECEELTLSRAGKFLGGYYLVGGPDFKDKTWAKLVPYTEDMKECTDCLALTGRAHTHVKASNPRKEQPIALGFFAYFPDSISEQARISKIGNDQHNPGESLHWDKSKSTDDLDCALRHLRDHLKGIIRDDDGGLHLGKAAWRLNAALQRFLEAHPEEIR